MNDQFISIDSGDMAAFIWARENWHLHLPERLAANQATLATLRKETAYLDR